MPSAAQSQQTTAILVRVLQHCSIRDVIASGWHVLMPKTTVGVLASLRRLHLGFNSLTGEIPVELGQLTSLEFLDLQSNHLSGTVPPLPALLQRDAVHTVPLTRRLR